MGGMEEFKTVNGGVDTNEEFVVANSMDANALFIPVFQEPTPSLPSICRLRAPDGIAGYQAKNI